MKKYELLLVDDVRLFLQLTKSTVSRGDYIIHTAKSGQQALAIARAARPDLIILDLHMPELNGDEVCRQIRSDPLTSDIPVIMVTTETHSDARKRSLYAGCDDFMTRPVRIGALNESVEKQLSAYERSYPRMNVLLPCILDSDRDQLLTNIYTLSAGGAYVEVDPPPLPGSDHLLTFFLPEEQANISVRALARWNRLTPGGRPPGSGFEFIAAEEESLDRLNHWAEAVIDDPVFG